MRIRAKDQWSRSFARGFSTTESKGAAPAARATIGVSVLTSGSSTTDATSQATASISPSANSLIVAVIGTAAATTAAPTASGGGMTTWDSVLSTNFVTTTRRLTYFRALEASPGSGALTFDFGGTTQTSFAWAVLQFTNVNTSGSNGAGAIVQSPAGTTGGGGITTLTKTLSAFEHANNVHLYLGAMDTNGTHTADAQFTELTDNGIASGAITVWSAWALTELTSDPTFTASSSGAILYNLEIKAG